MTSLFKVFIMTSSGRIGEYDVVAEGATEYHCISSYKNTLFVVKKSKTFKTRDDLKYNNFAVKLNEQSPRIRLKALNNTKKLDYKSRYIKDFPEKLI